MGLLKGYGDVYSKIPDGAKKIKLEQFAAAFTNIVSELIPFYINDGLALTPIKFNLLDDQSILIEWIFYNYRIGFSIDDDLDNCGWYIITTGEFDNQTSFGSLDFGDLEKNLRSLIKFAFSNS